MNKRKKIITVAIDSPAAAGAGTQAKLIATNYNLQQLDTGRIYRLIGRLKIKSIIFEENTSQKKSAFIVLNDITILIPLDGIVDIDKEIIKLEDKKSTYNEKLKSILGKLNNKAFIEKAPDNVIENFRIQEQDMKSSIEKINEIINTIN